MDKKIRGISFGLLFAYILKVGILGSTWQDITALGFLAATSILLGYAIESENAKKAQKQLQELTEKLEKLEKVSEDNKSALTVLKMNKGITTRRIG